MGVVIMRTFAARLGALVLTLTACGELPHDNPHDPQAPVGTQGRATLVGDVSLEPPGATSPSLSSVHVSVAGHSWAADTDADGHYEISSVPVGTWVIQFTRPGWDDQVVSGISVTLDDAGNRIPLPPIQLKVARGNVAGTIALQGETFASGVAISLDAPAAAAGAAAARLAGLTAGDGAVLTGADGSFLLSGVPVGSYVLRASKVGFLDGTIGSVSVTPSGVTRLDQLLLYIDPGGFSGSVLVQGAASSGNVTVRASGTTLNGSPWESTTVNRADGTFLLSGIPGGTYNVSFERTGYATFSTAAAVAPGVVTALPPVTLAADTGAVSGLATLQGASDSGGSLVELRVDAAAAPVAAAITDSLGAWRVDAVPVGLYQIAYSHAGYTPQTSSVTVASHLVTPAAPVTLAAQPGAAHGRVLAAGLAAGALGGTTVRIVGGTLSTVTLADGSWSISGIAAAACTLAFERPGYRAQLLSVTVPAGGDVALADVSLDVARGAVAGNVRLVAGAVTGFPVEADGTGTTVSLAGSGLPVTVTVTDALGNYRFTDVPVSPTAAVYTISATRAGYAQVAPVTASVQADTTAAAAALTLQVNPGGLAGTVQLWDNIGNSGANADSSGVVVSVSGVAFNGAPWSGTATTGRSGAFNVASLPRGTYDIALTSGGRACDAFPRAGVSAGAATALGTVQCRDTVPPGALVLGPPAHSPSAQAGFTNSQFVQVPVATQAVDPTLNLRGYQLAVGATPTWDGNVFPVNVPQTLFFTLPAASQPEGQRFVLWARAIDWMGNAGPATSVDVTYDGARPDRPTLATPRLLVNATSASVSLYGSEGDANFLRYEVVTAPCQGGAPSCAFTPTPSSFAVSLPADQVTTITARAVDRAGNVSDPATLQVTSDMTAPQPPLMAPRYDASRLTVRSSSVVFVPSADAHDPSNSVIPWGGLSWLEVDTGSGFTPLCPGTDCRSGGAWTPCTPGCACLDPGTAHADTRRVCDGTRFVGVRATLTGASTTVGFRAVDLAGNVGSSTSQVVRAQAAADILAAGGGRVQVAVLRGRLLGYEQIDDQNQTSLVLLDLGPDRRHDATDERCVLRTNVVNTGAVYPLTDDLVAYGASGNIYLRRRGAGGGWCEGQTDPLVSRGTSQSWQMTGDATHLAWEEKSGGAHIEVREVGADGLLGTGDDVTGTVPNTASSTIYDLHLGGRSLVFEGTSYAWHAIGANAAGSFLSGTTVHDFGVSGLSANQFSMDRAGTQVAWIGPGGTTINVRQVGASGVFDAASAQAALPALNAIGQAATVAIDGATVVAIEGGFNYGAMELLQWHADAAGSWANAGLPLAGYVSNDARRVAGLDRSLLVYSTASTIEGLDLATLRWEEPLLTGLLGAEGTDVLAGDDAGALYWVDSSYAIHALAPGGHEQVSAANLSNHVTAVGGGAVLTDALYATVVYLNQPDASGALFGHAQQLHTFFGRQVFGLAAGGGKALVAELDASYVMHPVVLEPNGGRLASFPTTGAAVDVYPAGCTNGSAPEGLAMNASQALIGCGGPLTATGVYVASAGPDGRFGTGDEPAPAPLVLPGGVVVNYSSPFRVSGTRLVVSDRSNGTFLLDAGGDGLFNTGDDRVRRLTTHPLSSFSQLAIAGAWAAWVDVDASGNEQVYLLQGFDGTPVQVTAHASTKDHLTLDPTGRLRWVDSVTAPRTIMLYQP
jgi:hypothetical protein